MNTVQKNKPKSAAKAVPQVSGGYVAKPNAAGVSINKPRNDKPKPRLAWVFGEPAARVF